MWGKGKTFTEKLLNRISGTQYHYDFYSEVESFNEILIEAMNKKEVVANANFKQKKLINAAAYLGLATIFSLPEALMDKVPKNNELQICRVPNKNDSDFELFNSKVETLALLVKQVSKLRPIKLPQDAIDVEEGVLRSGVNQFMTSSSLVMNPTLYKDIMGLRELTHNVGLLKIKFENYLIKISK
ncbi:hypothetical protein [Piscirickettsia litoralis]|uniref:Uncharacterized protein n=1 Tax=Piscirickettsia litoralis TaxID=1891921 RepID=A0ABX3A0N2_9GAMM|nr:hypothetical protein [Piscirickettsia litoralis]ODN41812.1 hypothetical protein BGC07_00980 [Piscirickettsia litoralis]